MDSKAEHLKSQNIVVVHKVSNIRRISCNLFLNFSSCKGGPSFQKLSSKNKKKVFEMIFFLHYLNWVFASNNLFITLTIWCLTKQVLGPLFTDLKLACLCFESVSSCKGGWWSKLKPAAEAVTHLNGGKQEATGAASLLCVGIHRFGAKLTVFGV